MRKKVSISIVSFLLFAASLWAGGWNNTLMGCRALALGGAFTGVADDPSAIFYNPAGLVFQREDFNFSIAGVYIWPTHEYVMSTGSKALSKYNSSLPQIFLTYRMNDRITIGFGAYVPYAGGGVDWKEDDLGHHFKSTLGVYTLTPTLAYQFSEKLSLGFNVNFYQSELSLDASIPLFGPMSTEEKGSAISAGFGLMFKPNEKVKIGLSIRGPTRMRLSGKTAIPITVPDFGTVEIKLESETSFNLPWDMEVGFSYRIAENFLLSTSAQYTMWSRLDKVEKTIKDIPLTGDLEDDMDMNFKDILILRAGAEYLFPQGVALRAGIGLDRYATPEEALDISNIDVDKVTLLGGIGYRVGKMQIDFVYVYAKGKEREKERFVLGVPIKEKYNLNAFILGLGVTFSF